MMHSADEPVYLISVMASLLDIHPQTLRQYERDGLISPSRTKGSIRLYSQNDLLKMQFILHLLRIEGINVAGVEMILRLQKYGQDMQREIAILRKELVGISQSGANIENSIDSCVQDMDLTIGYES